MTVFVDELRTHPGGIERCRMVATDEFDLGDMARKLGLHEEPVCVRGIHIHYLRPRQREEALRRGAREISAERIERRLGMGVTA